MRWLCIGMLLIGSCLRAAELPENFEQLDEDVQAVILEYLFFSEQADQVWGEDFAASDRYRMVKYLDNYHTRVMIDFAAGRIRIEQRGGEQPVQALRQAIVATLLTPADPNQVDLYTATDMGLTGKPFLAGRVTDYDGKDILFPWRANRFADELMQRALKRGQGRYWVDIPMVSNYLHAGARQYWPLVQAAAQKYQVSSALMLAIMETESSFNPMAVSPVRAYGLMQIMRKTAGRDVFERVYRRSGMPSRRYLFNPANNIDVGAAYLSILRDIYLKDIRGWRKRQYSMIASYNGGAGNLFKTFASSRKRAIARINAMSDQQVYNTIVRHHPAAETRRYLQKVTQKQQKYSAWK
ncbi:lytic murein transglycosylase [Bacterioplanes sanyensis]|uniref:Lytic murein transglycosylase n=1 Tax=Bacterioplanes sanyensis TaxID=1249553 RepID=A0A222FJU9_9GAMM|nr:murein transglycosylase domain-containing protein [Bacterioplanes sanyensis]ASP39317.1 lytic murein transglycosylase [Bacterioplanes sanyensis]